MLLLSPHDSAHLPLALSDRQSRFHFIVLKYERRLKLHLDLHTRL